jgi:hypothetical protein
MFVQKRRSLVVSMVCICVVLAACATQPEPHGYDPPGFLYGLLHGFIIFFSLIGGLFQDIRIYAFLNSGWWYDLGFFVGVGTWGGLFAAQ